MANVLNRSTLQFLESAHTPDYSTAQWVHNPDMSPVSSVASLYWKLSGDVVSEMSAAEKFDADGGLTSLKAARYLEIDTRTGQLIYAGFTYDSQTFSTSQTGQTNWNAIKDDEDEFTFPLDISTRDNDTYTLAQANVGAFWTAGKDFIQGHLNTGRVLKKSVFDAADESAVNAVVDAR